MSGSGNYLSAAEALLPRPRAHLYWPTPLVVDLDSGLLAGWAGCVVSGTCDPGALMLNRPAWELIRLQRRFRGRILTVSEAPPDMALWAAGLLGLGRSVLTLPEGGGAAGKVKAVARHFDTRRFDVLGSADLMSSLGGLARRCWLIGGDPELQRRMLTAGIPLYQLDPADRFALAQLAVVGDAMADWTVDERTATRAQSRRTNRKGVS